MKSTKLQSESLFRELKIVGIFELYRRGKLVFIKLNLFSFFSLDSEEEEEEDGLQEKFTPIQTQARPPLFDEIETSGSRQVDS